MDAEGEKPAKPPDPILKLLREKFPEELANLEDPPDHASVVELTVELLNRLWRYER